MSEAKNEKWQLVEKVAQISHLLSTYKSHNETNSDGGSDTLKDVVP